MKKIVIVNQLSDWKLDLPQVEVLEAKKYLTNPALADMKNVRIFNLCRNYKYQSTGYYVSLLAEARGHKAIPALTQLQDFKSQAVIRLIGDEIDELIQRSLKHLKSDKFVLSVYFEQNVTPQYNKLSKQLSNLFQAPLLRAHFVFNKKWQLNNVYPIPLNEIPENHMYLFPEMARDYFGRTRYNAPRVSKTAYDLAILYNPLETESPSNKKAIEKFVSVAEDAGFYVELITKEDSARLAEFDALFIRETTSVNHHTYRMARRAKAEGLVVIDDPESILRCTNKVYLAELLSRAKIATPKTLIIHKDNTDIISDVLGIPCVLKQPDSSFSQGVLKAKTLEDLKVGLEKMLSESSLVIGQEYLPTDYDWRIGVLDGECIFSCKYHMAKGHWQIYNWAKKGNDITGAVECVKLIDTPEEILSTALKAANLIGNGLYGVDLKYIDGKALIIEVNDNPSIDYGYEDGILGDTIYQKVIGSIKKRIENEKTLK
ncbi:MAG: glutathione synthase/RimK-type ligase-like ATP-grasp enzyme [Sphingobacteriales bacterium]|jgi:glutathione synthase/RimK-type ligase-like ATP-grasp enzyme